MKNFAIPKRLTAVLLVLIIAFSALSMNLSAVLAEVIKPEAPFEFAKLDGSEWAPVHPGMNVDYHSQNLDRKLNFTERNTETPSADTVYSVVTVSRPDMALAAADLTGYDVLSFMLTVEDNGAWNSYKDYISVKLETAGGNYHFSKSAVLSALSVVKPGKAVKVRLPLKSVGEGFISAVNKLTISVEGSESDRDLGIKITAIVAEVLPEEIILLDDEAGVAPKPAINVSGETAKLGTHSLKITTNNAGYMFFAGFMTSPAVTPVDISEITSGGTDGALRFWLYVDKASLLDDVKKRQAQGNKCIIKIGDCKKMNGDYLVWDNWINQVTNDGWNEVVLPFADHTIEGKGSKLTAIDTLSFKLSSGAASISMFVDAIRVSADASLNIVVEGEEGGEEAPSDPKDGVSIIDDEAGQGRYPAANVTAEDEGAQIKIGEHALKVNSMAGEGWVSYAGFYGADALPKRNISVVTENGMSGMLHFWAYVEDVAAFDEIKALEAGGRKSIIKLGDCRAVDGNYFRWENWLSQIKASGWNEITLKFADCVIEGTDPDTKAIDTLYMKLPDGSPSVEFYMDDLRVLPTDDGPAGPKKAVIAKLDGTEWPICHPGLNEGQFNTPDFEATHFDRRLSFIPSGDVRTVANVLRSAAGLKPVDASKHNIITMNITVEDNGAWDYYKDKLNIGIIDSDSKTTQISAVDVAEAFKSIIPGEPSKISLSLRSIGSTKASDINGVSFVLGDGFSPEVLHLTVTDICAEYNTDFPDLSADPVIPDDGDKEENREVIFAKLDGTEWPIVHPGMNSDYHAMNFDRHINFTSRTEGNVADHIHSGVNVIRSEISSYKPISFAGCNIISFNVLIEDNGAWNSYKDKMTVTFVDSNGVTHPIASADVNKGFESVVPGKWSEVKISLKSWHKGELENLNMFSLGVAGGQCDKDLHIRLIRVAARQDNSFAAVAEIPSNNDPLLLLNDELGENAWPAGPSFEQAKVGRKSYKATALSVPRADGVQFNEGWLIRKGFWGAAMERTFNIKDVTKNGTAGAVRFWIYVDDCEEFKRLADKNGQSYCRIGSAGGWDEDLYNWKGWGAQVIKDGWNEIVLPFSRASKQGNPDLTKITSFAIKVAEGTVDEMPPITVYIDNVRVSADEKTALPVSNVPTISGAKMWNSFDETFGLNGETPMTKFELDLEEKTQGMASLKFATETGSFTWVYRTGEGNEVDCTGYNALEFDLWVPEADFFEFAGGAIELTSSGIWDQNEISWGLGDLQLKKGWNHIKLSFDFAGVTTDWKGECDVDFTKLNFMRIYTGQAQTYVGKELTFRIDNMCFSKSGEEKIEKSVITTNATGYELYLTAKPEVIPEYGELVVESQDMSIIPEAVAKEFEADKDTIILDPTFYKDTLEYLFTDTVTVHLKKEKLTALKEMYLYRLDVNGSFRKLARIDNKAKKELIWDEPTRLATYIISDVLIEDEKLEEIEQNLASGNSGVSDKKDTDKPMNMALAVGIAAAALVVLAGGVAAAIILIKKNRKVGK